MPSDFAPSPEEKSLASLQDRIYEWSTEIAPWQQDLLCRLTRGPLSSEDEDEVLKILLKEDDAPSPQTLERADLPADEAEVGVVELREISDVQNVNLLAEGQTLYFEPGINVVFGATGAGKSGYGRLLQRLCKPAERTKVLPDAFDSKSKGKQQTVTVRITVDGEEREIFADLADKPEPVLSTIGIFDAARTPVCVSKPNLIKHVPEPLILMRRLAEAHDALQSRLKKRIATLRAELPSPTADPATSADRLMVTITAKTDLSELERLAKLSDAERAEIKHIDVALMAFESDYGHQLEVAARAAERVADELEHASEKLAKKQIDFIADLRTRLDETTDAEHKLAADAFSEQSFPGTGQEPWWDMWEAARRFVEAGGGTFPNKQSAACPLCQQNLGEDSPERMMKFEEFVRSDLREKIAALTRDLDHAVSELPDITAIRALVDASLSGTSEAISTSASNMIDALSARVELARRYAEGPIGELGPAPELPPVTPIRAYANEQAEIAKSQVELQDEAAQQRLIDRRAELRKREELAAELPKISERIAGLKKIAQYKEIAATKLSTWGIGFQLHKLQGGILTNRLRKALTEELEALDLLAGKVKVSRRARKGQPAIEFGLRGPGQAKVVDVLSEGEQRGLALAFFLAESSVNGGRSAIVLDDPAALLDFERRKYVAERLVEEAEWRQVIVFTHDIAFIQMLQQEAKLEGQKLHRQALQQADGHAGVASDDLPSGAITTE